MEQAEALESPARIACKHCESTNTNRSGFASTGRQRYFCKDCNRAFVENGAPSGMRFPAMIIASALIHFYRGSSLHDIRRKLMLQDGVVPDHATIRRWVARYTRQSIMVFAGIRPEVGQEWAVCETSIVMRMSGPRRSKTLWLWDIMDTRTRFLLASGVSGKREGLDFYVLLDLAQRRANKKPESIFADVTVPIEGDFQRREATASVQEVLKPLGRRNSILHRLRGDNFAHLIVSGWAVHYNFFRTHPALEGKTPAEAAGVSTAFKSWADIVSMR